VISHIAISHIEISHIAISQYEMLILDAKRADRFSPIGSKTTLVVTLGSSVGDTIPHLVYA